MKVKPLTEADIAEDVLARLWEKVQVGAEGECWPWISPSADRWGYGILRGGARREDGRRRHVMAHRVVCQANHGQPPDPQCVVRHLCGFASCCNPDHLAWGTNSENMADQVEHGTAWWVR